MYNPIIMSDLKRKPSDLVESFNITINMPDELSYPNYDQLYQEAVFSSGKEKMKDIEDAFASVKKILVDEVNKQKESDGDPNKKGYKFNPNTYWKRQEFKELENAIQKTFGFRSVEIIPYIEKFNSDDDKFDSNEFNCETSMWDRFPIDGLVTDKGFYDNTHSITLSIAISCGVIYQSEPDEIVAAMLHEIGHNIDPALVTISYAETNILAKYLTDRNTKLTKAEKKAIALKKIKNKKGIGAAILIKLVAFTGIFASIIAFISFIAGWMRNSVKSSTKGDSNDKIINTLKSLVTEDVKSEFNRKDYSEAFADNFARMYGYGPELVRFFKKIGINNEREIKSRFKREKDRQWCIARLTISALKDEHKTNVHRIKALIKEYRADINDPNTPPAVKKRLEEDVKEVELVLDEYLNNFSEFQNKVNKLISDAIDEADGVIPKKDDSDDSKEESKSDEKKEDSADNEKDDKQKEIQESVTFFESRAAYQKLIKAKGTITSAERAEIKKRFGNTACSFARDKKGIYCYTHRCRSDSYNSIAEIPQKVVDFVSSTA